MISVVSFASSGRAAARYSPFRTRQGLTTHCKKAFTRRVSTNQPVAAPPSAMKPIAAVLLIGLLAFPAPGRAQSHCEEPEWVGPRPVTADSNYPGITRIIYVAANGDDGRSAQQAQNEQTPWKTIDRVNAYLDASTDAQVEGTAFLFRRGDRFPGKIVAKRKGTRNKPIQFGSYGDVTQEAVIDGAIPLTGWNQHQGFIYRVDGVWDPVLQLYANDGLQTRARTPNTGFFSADSGGTTSLTSGQLTGTGNWTGGTVRARTSNWTYESRSIDSQTGNTLSFSSSPFSYALDPGWGFYVEGSLTALDAPGEWYHDAALGRLYFWAPANVNPNALSIRGAIHDAGIETTNNRDGIIVSDLSFSGQTSFGVYLQGGNAADDRWFRVENNRFRDNGGACIWIWGTDGSSVEDNELDGCLGQGIVINRADNAIVERNRIIDTGVVAGYGRSGVNGAVAILVDGSYNEVRRNYIENTGYIGIRADGVEHVVEENILTDTMLTLADGAALYQWSPRLEGTRDITFERNIVCDVHGFGDGRPDPEGTLITFGIYLDNKTARAVIKDNTVVNAATGGLNVNTETYNHTISGNVFYGGGDVQVGMNDNNGTVEDVLFENNTLVALTEEARLLSHFVKSDSHDFGTFRTNSYVHPSSNLVLHRKVIDNSFRTDVYTSPEFTSYQGGDPSSEYVLEEFRPCDLNSASRQSLITNSTFDQGRTGWRCWTGNGSCNLATSANSELSGQALNISYVGNRSAFVYFSSFPWEEDELYVLSFDAVGAATDPDQIRAISKQHSGSYSELQTLGYMPLRDAVDRHEIVFRSTSAYTPGRIDFISSAGDWWMDNVRLEKITSTCEDLTPSDYAKVFVNGSDQALSFSLTRDYQTTDGQLVSGSINVPAFGSVVLLAADQTPPAPPPSPTVDSSASVEIDPHATNGKRWDFFVLRIENTGDTAIESVEFAVRGGGAFDTIDSNSAYTLDPDPGPNNGPNPVREPTVTLEFTGAGLPSGDLLVIGTEGGYDNDLDGSISGIDVTITFDDGTTLNDSMTNEGDTGDGDPANWRIELEST